MNRDDTILGIAKKNGLVRQCNAISSARYHIGPADENLVTMQSDGLDFYEVAVWNVKKALEEAYDAGYRAAVGIKNPIDAAAH